VNAREMNESDFLLLCRRIRELALHPGWQDICQQMETIVEGAIKDLLQYEGSDPAKLQQLHNRARALNEFKQRIEDFVQRLQDDFAEERPATSGVSRPMGW